MRTDLKFGNRHYDGLRRLWYNLVGLTERVNSHSQLIMTEAV